MPQTAEDLLTESRRLLSTAREMLENSENGFSEGSEDYEKFEKIMADSRDAKRRAIDLQNLDNEELEVGKLLDVDSQQRSAKPTPKSKFASWGDFLQRVHNYSMTGRGGDVLKELIYYDGDNRQTNLPRNQRDLSEDTGASGGFLVPEEFMTTLQAIMAEDTIVRRRATIIPMRRRQVNIPVVDQTSTTPGQPHHYGGMTFQWQDEGTQKTQSDPAFRSVELIAYKLIGYTVSGDELLDDAAVSLESFLSGPMGFAGGAAWTEDYAFLNGDGVGKPLGIINSPALKAVTRATGSQINYADIISLEEGFLPSGNGAYVANQTAMSQLLTMEGPSGNPSYLWGPNSAVAGQPATLFGRPIEFTEKTPALGSLGDLLLADFRYYLVGDRQATTVESTKFDQWRYDKTSWRMVHRVGGIVWLSTPITLADGSTTVSPFVAIAA